EQAGAVGRPANLLDRAEDLPELRAVYPERQPAFVAAVGGVGQPRPVRREARQRARLALAQLAADPSRPELRLDPLALLAVGRGDRERHVRPVRRERDLAGPPDPEQ